MKAALLVGPHNLQLAEVPYPTLPDNDSVIMKVHAMGICGSDVHAYHGKLATVTYPRIIGHEVVGEIVEAGSAVTKLTVGDHAVLDPVVSCGACPACRKGRNNVCKEVKCMGVAAEGGCAEYVALPSGNVHKIPSDIPWRDAVLLEPYTIGAQITARGEVGPDDTVVVMGAGTIGLVALQAAKRAGAKVLVSDPVAFRRDLACKLDADMVIDPVKHDIKAVVDEWTGGEGVAVVVDAVGVPALLEQALEITAPAARIVIIGFNPADAQVPELPITRKELDIRGSRMHAGKFPAVIEWLARKEVKTGPLVSHEFAFAKIHDAFELLEKNPEETCKVIITF